MGEPALSTSENAAERPGLRRAAVAALFGLGMVLAVTSLTRDSVTWDETAHLTSGYSYLRTGDFRLAPDHPPLAKMWAALPLWLAGANWSVESTFDWHTGNAWECGRTWLFHDNDGQRLIASGRLMMVGLLVGLWLATYRLARATAGPAAALLALAVAVLCPTFLAHGRLVTTDLPATLLMWVTLLCWVRALRRLTIGRGLCAIGSLAALSLTKFSWPLILPALGVMAAVSVFRSKAWPIQWKVRKGASDGERALATRGQRALGALGLALAAGAGTWVAIWTAFGWSYSSFRGADRESARMMPPYDDVRPVQSNMAEAWQSVMTDGRGAPLQDRMARALDWARQNHLLPEGYLFGLAYTHKSLLERSGYLFGKFSNTGWREYFAIAFLLKTPLPTMALMLLGLAAWLRMRPRCNGLLLSGALVLVATVGVTAVLGNLNIGQRHILPLYPAVAAAAGAAWLWRGRIVRGVVAALLVWLAVENVRGYPDYLSYFNELIGRRENAMRYLADSNLDWGQDLLRLKDWANAHPDERLKLAVGTSLDPRCYVPQAEWISGDLNAPPPGPLTPGTYIASVNQLIGLYDPLAREDFWKRRQIRTTYREAWEQAAHHRDGTARLASADFNELQARLAQMQVELLLVKLNQRPPDEWVGRSLLVFRLSKPDLDRLLTPP